MNKIKINYYSTPFYALIFLALISFFGAVVYRVYSLNNIGVAISLILAIISFFIIQRFKTGNKKQVTCNIKRVITNTERNTVIKKIKLINLLLVACYLLLVLSLFYILFTSQTTESIISPWQVMPNYFFIVYGLATAVLVFTILRINNAPTTYKLQATSLIIIHYFLSFSIVLIIYKIGYGFDSFIHQATVDLINKTGSVEPKPFYYLGQYSLVVILHKITTLPLIWLDKLLAPLLAAIYLPITLWRVFKKLFADNKSSLLLILTVLILPFSFLIATTPQNFAYLLLLIIILLGLACKNIYDLIIIYVLALTAAVFQPIAGIPAIMFALLLTVYHSDVETQNLASLRKYFYSLIFIISSIALPLAFYLLNGNKTIPPFVKGGLGEFMNGVLPTLTVPSQENFILNFIYLYGFNLKIIIGVITITGLIIAYRHRRECKIFFIYLIMSLSLGISYLLVKILPFSFLIDYEKNNYSDRILLISIFFLAPFILTALYGFIHRTLKQKNSVKIPLLLFMVILITASLYLSYPRFDRYFNSRGYSVGQSDIDAARRIEKNSEQDYIVLANQQVSAAALREFGFKKYYETDSKSKIFYYPIPTGGPLYQYYLDMVYKKPSRRTMLAAMELTGVNEGYFVLNKYWWAFPKILEEAKLEADSWEEIYGGEVYIFKYKYDKIEN